MDAGELHRTIQQLKRITKYGMTCICLLMTVHCGLLYFDIDAILIHVLFWFFVMLIGIQLSRIFGLCWVHRISVVYSMSVIFCVVLYRQGIFDVIGIDIHCARFIMFIIGVIMVILNIWKILPNKKNLQKNL